MASVGVVLGAGGLVGWAWHAGVLDALAEEVGFDARHAEVLVGTSAGAVVAAVLRGGLSPEDLAARVAGEPLSPAGEALLHAVGHPAPLPAPAPRDGMPLPAAPRLAARELLVPWRLRPSLLGAALMPPGQVPTTAIGDTVRPLHHTPWPAEPTWLVAVCLDDGRRVVFGRDHEPTPDVATAAEASSAVPGWFAPVTVDGRRYVDGGAHSATNADVLAGLGFDLVVVSSPMSATRAALRRPPAPWPMSLSRWLGRGLRGADVAVECAGLRRSGTPVLVIQPTAEDLGVLGAVHTDERKLPAVVAQARASTRRRLGAPVAAARRERLVAAGDARRPPRGDAGGPPG